MARLHGRVGLLFDRKKTDYSLLEKTDIHLLLGIKGSVDIKLSKGIDALKHSGYLFETKIFTGMWGTAVLLVSILINRQRKCGCVPTLH